MSPAALPDGVYDISPELTERTAVFPGDVPLKRNIAMDFKSGDHLLLSSVTTTLHVGAHTDAPNHYDPQGIGIGERTLRPYLGSCQVIRVAAAPGERIGPRHLAARAIHAPRVLFRTDSFPDPNRWRADFNSLSPELVDHLSENGVILVGIDTPSIDPETSQALEAHARVAAHDMAILEGIVLTHVPDGDYTLLALPLRLTGADASPVRAVLVRDPAMLSRM